MKLVDRNLELSAGRRDLVATMVEQRRDLHQPALGIPRDESGVGPLSRLVGAQPGDPGRGTGQRPPEWLDLPNLTAGQPRVLRMVEAVDSAIGDHRCDGLGVRVIGADSNAVALLRLLPELVGRGEKPAGIERHNLDRKSLTKNMVRDQLVFDAEAGGEDDAPGDCLDRRAKTLGNAVSDAAVERGNDRRLGYPPGKICVRHTYLE